MSQITQSFQINSEFLGSRVRDQRKVLSFDRGESSQMHAGQFCARYIVYNGS